MRNITLTLEPNERRYYYPGQELSGTAVLHLENVKKFRGFYIKIFGQAKAHWSKGSGKTTKCFEGVEVFIDSRIYLLGSRGESTIEVQPGNHEFNFVFQLPQNLPSSINMKNGKISYYVEAVLDIPWRFDKEVKIPFPVVRCDDLNVYRNLREPVRIIEVKTFSSLFASNTKPLQIIVSLPYSGFVVGQDVSITIDYENGSSAKVVRTSIQLVQSIVYFSPLDGESETKKNAIVHVHSLGVDAGCSNKFLTTFEIPPTINSNSKFCKVIQVSYFIEVEALMNGIHCNPKIKFPIIIGNIPIRFDDQRPTTPSIYPSAPPSIQPSAPPEEQHDDDLPPSYDEAIQASAEALE